MDLIFNRSLQRRRHRRYRQQSQRPHPLHQMLHEVIQERLSCIRRDFNAVLIMGEFEYRSPCRSSDPSPPPPDILVKVGRDLEALPEHLPFQKASFDLIISYMDLHQANDIPGILHQIRDCLKPEGAFLGVFIGGESLRQLRIAAYQAELMTRGGCSPRVVPMITLSDAAALLQRAGFVFPVVDHEGVTLTDPNPQGLLRQLRDLNLSNTLDAGFKGLSGKRFFAELYHQLTHQLTNQLELDLIFVSGWAPVGTQ
jgi:NADH dehydrogenase [ubiquinone] 1 alpha subcomplex assembly factor 5